MKNELYATPSFTDAMAKKEFYEKDRNREFYIDSVKVGSRTDANGEIVETRTYEVYTIVNLTDEI